MGAERYIQFTNNVESVRVLHYLEPLRGWIELKLVEPKDYMTGCHLEWTTEENSDDPYLAVGYSFGANYGAEVAAFTLRELTNRFSTRRIGADSTGWWTDEVWTSCVSDDRHPVATYGSYTSWVDWIKSYQAVWSPEIQTAKRLQLMSEPFVLPNILHIEKEVTRIFVELDKTCR